LRVAPVGAVRVNGLGGIDLAGVEVEEGDGGVVGDEDAPTPRTSDA